jgi:hypothetical protein
MDIINSIIEFFNRTIFTAFSNLSSIVGLIISIFVLIRIKGIERNYIIRFRVPALISKIEEQASYLSDYLNDYPNFIIDIKAELARAKADLESLKGKVNRQTRKSIRLLLKQVKRYHESHEQLTQVSFVKRLLYHIGLYRLGAAGRHELRSDSKRDAVYSIYESMLTLTREVANTQEDKRLD